MAWSKPRKLFLSPRRQEWTKNVKYVIFDEVDWGEDGSLSLPCCISICNNNVNL